MVLGALGVYIVERVVSAVACISEVYNISINPNLLSTQFLVSASPTESLEHSLHLYYRLGLRCAR